MPWQGTLKCMEYHIPYKIKGVIPGDGTKGLTERLLKDADKLPPILANYQGAAQRMVAQEIEVGFLGFQQSGERPAEA